MFTVMIKIFAKTLLVVIILMTTACNDEFLERQATNSIPEENIFRDPALIQLL